jgi:hypothetical protein
MAREIVGYSLATRCKPMMSRRRSGGIKKIHDDQRKQARSRLKSKNVDVKRAG